MSTQLLIMMWEPLSKGGKLLDQEFIVGYVEAIVRPVFARPVESLPPSPLWEPLLP